MLKSFESAFLQGCNPRPSTRATLSAWICLAYNVALVEGLPLQPKRRCRQARGPSEAKLDIGSRSISIARCFANCSRFWLLNAVKSRAADFQVDDALQSCHVSSSFSQLLPHSFWGLATQTRGWILGSGVIPKAKALHHRVWICHGKVWERWESWSQMEQGRHSDDKATQWMDWDKALEVVFDRS